MTRLQGIACENMSGMVYTQERGFLMKSRLVLI